MPGLPSATPAAPNGPDDVLRTIMRRYQAGDVGAFDELYHLTLPMIRGYLTTVAWDRTHSSDLVQDAYLQLHRSRHTYNGSLPVRPWMLGIARHVWLMHQRSQARRQHREVVGLEEVHDPVVPPDIERLGDRDELTKALTRIRTDHRESLVLHHVYGLSFREIAGIAGITAGAARTRASRGICELRSALSGTRRTA